MIWTERKKIWLLFGIALIIRLIAWPFSQVMEADAVSRMFAAEDVIRHHGAVSCLQWPSGHIYFLSLGQLLTNQRIFGSVLLSVLAGAGSVIPFYLFTRNVFNRTGAFYAALIFTCSPLIIRLSMVPLSEIYHVFFSLMAIWALTEALRNPERKMRWTIFAGIFATIACGGRFEAWVMSGLLGLILLTRREWKMFFVFGAVSAIYPIGWMLFCHAKTGSYFVSLEMVQFQNFVVTHANDNLDAVTMIRRTIFFPLSWMIAITPVVMLLLFSLLPRLVKSWRTEPLRLLFIALFVFFLVFFIFESRDGSLADQHRYSVTLVMLSMPLFALWFENPRRKKAKIIVSVLLAATMIPWSYCWERIPWHKLAFGNTDRHNAIAQIVSGTYKEFHVIPQIEPAVLKEITEKERAEYKKGEGLFIDFWGWAPSYYVQMQSPYDCKLYMTYDYPRHDGDQGRIATFFQQHPTGQIVLFDYSSLSREIHLHGNLAEIDSVPGGLLLEPRIQKDHIRLFNYRYLSAEETAEQRQKLNFTPPLYTREKDLRYYLDVIPCDGNTLSGIWQEAVANRRSVDEQVRRVAEWQLQNDIESQKKTNTDSVK